MDGAIAAHKERMWAWTESLLRPYLDAIGGQSLSRSRKEFNDPVWGTVYLDAHEVVVLDSPLLQRLRTVRQLGIVHYVYQGATHSRLEHSIGVVHQMQRMITSLNNRGLVEGRDTADPHSVIGPDLETTLRLTALCHDIGHGFMSHVSEYALRNDRACRDLQLSFQEAHRRPAEPQLSEIGAYYAISSPAFANLVNAAFSQTGSGVPEGLTAKMADLVIGKPVDDRLLLLHEFVSGPFDADKLDYYARDAAMCGIPNITDIPRLIQKLRAATTERDGLPPAIRKGTPAHGRGYVITGIATSGGRTLDELELARTLLYDKVYRHQKVRAIESMVFRIVHLLAALSEKHPTSVLYALRDDDVLLMDAHKIASVTDVADVAETHPEVVNTIIDLSRRLRDRDLFVRGFAFASVMTDDDYRNDPDQIEGMQTFLEDAPDNSAGFMQIVVQHVLEIIAVTDCELTFDIAQLEHYLRLSPPKSHDSSKNNSTGNAQLIETDGKITPFRDDAAETTPWSNAYIATRDLGHIFCPPELAPLVYVAAEAALLSAYTVRVPRAMLHYAKQKEGALEELRHRLEDAGWYDDKPHELRPYATALTDADAANRVELIAARLLGYWGPTRADDANRSLGAAGTVAGAQVTAYVKQFASGGSDLVDAALTTLNALKIVGRDDARSTINRFFEENPDFRGSSCAPLGAEKDSGSVLTYFVSDVAEEHDLKVGSVLEAAAAEPPVIFVDDFIGTGRQAIDIVEAWLGVDRSNPLGEERDPLPTATAQQLRGRRLGFVFVAATGNGPQVLRERLREIGLDAVVFVGISPDSLPTLQNVEGLEPAARERLTTFAAERGHLVLAEHNGVPRDDDWRSDKLLGFGNDGFLVASAFNTPTAALTVLWAEDKEWKPLLPRRTKR